LIEKDNPAISIARQTELLGMSRSNIYYQPIVDPEEIRVMNAIDKIYTKRPFYGSRKIMRDLKSDYQIKACRERVQRLMRIMGLEAIYPKKKPNTSSSNIQHKKFPYLLKELQIQKPNQVWGTDITYIRLKNGFIYLTAIIDWYSRYILSWKLSPTLENEFCVAALKEALEINIPDIHNSDQGVHYTAQNYVSVLEGKEIQISMDGRGRCMDNIFTERLWRTVKYENVFLQDYADIEEARSGLSEYLKFYNEKRKHQSLNYLTPSQIYFSK
jgi:putative transposase